MALKRTMKFCGYAYGNVPVQLNAHINGVQVFSGTVATLNETMPDADLDMKDAPALFTVENSELFLTTFEGFYPMTLSVATGDGVLVADTLTNYTLWVDTNGDPQQGTADKFVSSYDGTPVNSESTPDPRSSVTIDGAAQVPPLEPSPGIWTWVVPAGSTLACNLNVSVGSANPDIPPN